jgi:hypothetical protein
MIVAPLGGWLTDFDAAMLAGLDTLIVGLSAKMFRPMLACSSLHYLFKGLRVMQGDQAALDNVLWQTLKLMMAFIIATDPAWFNVVVRDFLFLSVPGYLIDGATAGQAVAAGIASPNLGVDATARMFDQNWATMWVIAGKVEAHAGLLDLSTRVGGLVAVMIGAILQALMALVYLCARATLACILGLGDIVIALYSIEQTQGVLEKWLAKVTSLIFLQVAVAVVLSLEMGMMQRYLDLLATSGSSAAGAISDLQNLFSMVIILFISAFLVIALPAMAYSLGGGIAISTIPILAAAIRGATAMAGYGTQALNAIPPYPTLPPPLQIGIPIPAGTMLGSGGGSRLPPPMPPSLSSYGPTLLR